MSSETRVIRPYVGGDEFQQVLDQCRLRCANRVAEGGTEIAVSLDEYLNFPFAVEFSDVDWDLIDDGLTALELDPSDVDLQIVAIAPRLRFNDVVFRGPLDSAATRLQRIELSGAARPRSLSAPHGGTDLQILFCLNRTLDPRPIRPWRQGTWLGRQDFRIRSELTGSGFVPVRLTDVEREELGLSRDTVRFATLDDGDPFDVEPGNDMVKLYVDGELLDRLAVAAGTPSGRQIQQQLFLDAASAIAFAAQRRFREDPYLARQHVDDFRGSLVHRLTEYVTGREVDSAGKDRRQTAFRRLCDDPMVFLAQVEARTGIRKEMLATLGEPR